MPRLSEENTILDGHACVHLRDGPEAHNDMDVILMKKAWFFMLFS